MLAGVALLISFGGNHAASASQDSRYFGRRSVYRNSQSGSISMNSSCALLAALRTHFCQRVVVVANTERRRRRARTLPLLFNPLLRPPCLPTLLLPLARSLRPLLSSLRPMPPSCSRLLSCRFLCATRSMRTRSDSAEAREY